MKVYISLPITGKDLQEQKRHADDVATFLLTAGFTPVNPFNNGLNDGAPYEEHMREDLKMMLGCEAVFLCKVWTRSRGCLLEREAAKGCGLTIVSEGMPTEMIYEELKARRALEEGGRP